MGTPQLTGEVHEDVGAGAGLGIFVGDVADGGVVADVFEVLLHAGADGNLAELDVELLGEGLDVGVGAVRGAEARHCHGEDGFARG